MGKHSILGLVVDLESVWWRSLSVSTLSPSKPPRSEDLTPVLWTISIGFSGSTEGNWSPRRPRSTGATPHKLSMLAGVSLEKEKGEKDPKQKLKKEAISNSKAEEAYSENDLDMRLNRKISSQAHVGGLVINISFIGTTEGRCITKETQKQGRKFR